MLNSVIDTTQKLFGNLWHRYDEKLFEDSVALFRKRCEANGFDLQWFKGKECLDVGCGGGRYSMALSRLGAKHVIGCDISAKGLEDARKRIGKDPSIEFVQASALHLPWDENRFDFVCCAGVLHHTESTAKGLLEIARVLKPGGKLFLLLYGSGGLRWKTTFEIRPIAAELGFEFLDQLFKSADFAVNKQRTFLDDFFVPILNVYDWKTVKTMLEDAGFSDLQRWTEGRLDHEASVEAQRGDLEVLKAPFVSYLARNKSDSKIKNIIQMIESSIEKIDELEALYQSKKITKEERDFAVIGWGHHRVVASFRVKI